LIIPLGVEDPRIRKLVNHYQPDQLLVIRNAREPAEHEVVERELDKTQKDYKALLKEGAKNETVLVDYFNPESIAYTLIPELLEHKGDRVILAINQGSRLVTSVLTLLSCVFGGVELVWLPRKNYTVLPGADAEVDDEWFKSYTVHFEPKALLEKLVVTPNDIRLLRQSSLFTATGLCLSFLLTVVGLLPLYIGIPTSLLFLAFLLPLGVELRKKRIRWVQSS
jgi:hypothetical protein